jgi:hypothetical protein
MLRLATAAVVLALAAPPLHAQALAGACGASSRYDLTLSPRSLAFDSGGAPPRHVVVAGGSLTVDGRPVPPAAGQRERLAHFEREVRAVVAAVRALATQAVDVASDALHAQAAAIDLDPATRRELDRRLAAHAATIKRRIAASSSTRDWHGDALAREKDALVADIAPLLAAALARQAVQDALAGDVEGAADLQARAAALATDLQPALERRLAAMRPRVEALCPSLQRLAELQAGWRDADGRPLDLLEVAHARARAR